MKKKEKLKEIFAEEKVFEIINPNNLNINSLMNGGTVSSSNNNNNGTSIITYGPGKATQTPHGNDYSVRTNYGNNDLWYTDGIYYKDLGIILYPKS